MSVLTTAEVKSLGVARFAGLGRLVALALRRDRLLLAACIVAAAGIAGFSARATRALYPDDASIAGVADTFNSTFVLIALYGRIYDASSVGAIALSKLIVFWAAVIVVFMGWLVVRHTRADEEAGRLELIGATAVNRASPLMAAVATAILASLALGAASALALSLGGLPLRGAVVFGAMWASVGVLGAGLGSVAAQVSSGARAATGGVACVVLLAYMLRVLGDRTNPPSTAMWLSPLGWGQQMRPFAGDRLWPAVLLAALSAVLIWLAFVLQGRREYGAGMLRERAPREGRWPLAGSFALAWRLQRVAAGVWLLALVLLGVLLGLIAESINGLLDSPQVAQLIRQIGGTDVLVDGYLAAALGMTALGAAAFGISAADRLFAEEHSGRAELLLASPLPRARLAWSHVSIALVGTALMVLASAAAMGLGLAVATTDTDRLGRLLTLSVAAVPAALVLPCLVVLGFGLVPRFSSLGWVALAVFAVLGQVGRLIGLPTWLLNLSPFAHSPVPGGPIDGTTVLVLFGVCALLVAAGFAGWRARDVR